MPKTKSATSVTRPAARDRRDVSRAKARASRRTSQSEAPTSEIQTQSSSDLLTLPPVQSQGAKRTPRFARFIGLFVQLEDG